MGLSSASKSLLKKSKGIAVGVRDKYRASWKRWEESPRYKKAQERMNRNGWRM